MANARSVFFELLTNGVLVSNQFSRNEKILKVLILYDEFNHVTFLKRLIHQNKHYCGLTTIAPAAIFNFYGFRKSKRGVPSHGGVHTKVTSHYLTTENRVSPAKKNAKKHCVLLLTNDVCKNFTS